MIIFVYFSEKEYEGEYAFEAEKRNKIRTVFVTGRDGLTPQQAAVLLVQEARMLVQVHNLYFINRIHSNVHSNKIMIVERTGSRATTMGAE